MSWMIYLMSIVDSLGVIFGAIFLLLALGLGFALIFGFASETIEIGNGEDESDESKNFKEAWKSVFKIWAIVTALSCLIPDSKTLAAMYLIPKITGNEQVQQLPDKVLDVLNLKLDEWIGDLTKKEGSQKQ